MDSDNEVTKSQGDVNSAASMTTKSNVDVGPPVNIYAEAHRHAQIKASNESDEPIDGHNSTEEEGSDTDKREGPHASLHLSSELKQNQTKLSDENNEQVADNSVDGNDSDGAESVEKNVVAEEQEAIVEVSIDDVQTDDNDAEKESEQQKNVDVDQDASSQESDTDTTTEDDKQPNRTRAASEDEEDDDGPAKIILVDYASKLAGAQVLEKSPSFKGASNLLTGDSDKYAIAPCEDKKYVVIGLSEDILVKQIKLSNFERYSSHVREFHVLASQEYPAPSAEYWTLIGTFEANARNGEQTFDLEEPAWARYLKFKFRSHYGAEHYCTLSQIKVHGSTMLQGFHEQWIESEKELEQEMENQQQQQQQEDNHQGELDDSDAQSTQPENVVDEHVPEESSDIEIKKGDDGGMGRDNVPQSSDPEPIADNVDNSTEQNLAAEASSNEDVSEGGGTASDEVVVEVGGSPSYDEEKDATKDDGAIESNNDTAVSIPNEEEPGQQVVLEVSKETKVDVEILDKDESDNTLGKDSATNASKSDQQHESDVAGYQDQTDPNKQATNDHNVSITEVEKESGDTISDVAGTGEETIPSGDTATQVRDDEDVSGPSNDNIDEENDEDITESPISTNKTSVSPPSSDEQSNDAKSGNSGSAATNVQKLAVDDTKSNTKDAPSEPLKKDVVAKKPPPLAEQKDVRVSATTNAELFAKLSKRYPHVSCIKDLDFHAFKSRTHLSNAGQAGQVPGPKMEPIFAKITNEIKSVQMTQHQYEQYISAVKTCYEKLFLDMAKDLDSIQIDYDRRLSNLEKAMSNVSPGFRSKAQDYKFIAITSLTALSNSEYAPLGLLIGITILITLLGIRRKKTYLKKPSNQTPKSSASPAKDVAVMPSLTPSSSTNTSPSTNDSAKNYDNEPTLQSERSASCQRPTLVLTISSEEKENKDSTAVVKGKVGISVSDRAACVVSKEGCPLLEKTDELQKNDKLMTN